MTVTNAAAGGEYDNVSKNYTATVTDDETKNLSLSPESDTLTEGGAAKTYTVTLSAQPTSNVTVSVTSGDTDAATVSPSKLTFSTSNYNTAQTVTVSAEDDDDGKDESVTIGNAASGGGYNGKSADYSATVTDDDRGVTVSPTSVTITEGANTPKKYTVTLAAEPAASVTVAVASGDTEAATVSPSKLTFSTSNYNTAQTVTVSAEDDADGENETVTITNTADSGYGSEAASVTATVTDDETKGLTLTPTSGTVTEGANTPKTYTVTLATQPTSNVTVSVTSGDTDAATVSPSALTFTTGDYNTAQTVTVSAVDDADGENESVTIGNAASGGGYNGKSADYSATVTDDDTKGLTLTPSSGTVTEGGSAVKYTVTLATAPTSNVTVSVTSGDTDIATVSPSKLTFSTSNYNTAQTVTVSAANDSDGKDESVTIGNAASGGGYNGKSADYSASVIDDDRGVTVSPSSVTVTEGSNTTVKYTVKLAAEPSASVTVTVVSDDTDAATVSPSALTFSTSSYNTAQTVTVSPVDDADGENESVTIANTADSGYGSVTANVTATVTDNNTKGLTLTPSSGTVTEGGASVKYTVTLATAPTSNVTVSVTSDDTDAVTVSPSALTFSTSNYNTAQTVTVSPEDDADGKDESVTVSNAASGGGYNGKSADYSATVIDDDRGLTVSPGSDTLIEGGAAKTYTVKLAAEPAASVTVGVTSEDTDAVTASPSKLTFSTSSYNTAQTVTVSAVSDADGENETVTVSNAASGGGYNNVSKDYTANVTDDDSKNLSLSPTSGTVTEGGSSATYTVTLSAQPTGNVTVSVTSGDTDAATASPSALTFSTSNYGTNQTVTVSAANDSDGKNESVTIGNAASGGGYNGKSADYAASVTDDDRGLTMSPASVTVAEGSTATYTVQLAAEPAASVTVAVARTSGDTDLAVDKSSLTFSTSNYNTSQTVTVSAAEDNDYLDGTATYTHTASGGDYGNVSATLTATEDDNDLPVITLSLNPISVDENASPTTVTVTVSRTGSVSVTTVTVKVGKSNDSAVSGTDYTAVSDFTITIADGQTSKTGPFTLAPIDNSDDEADKHITVSATVEGAEVGATRLTLVDDDEPQTVEPFNQVIDNQIYVQDSAIATLTLPAATNDDGTLTYSLSPALPDGLTFDADARTITGTPSVVMAETTYTYTATNEGGDTTSLTFTITVIAADKKPVFVDAIDDQSYTQNTAIATLALPTATGGDGVLTYALSPSPPDGLTFDASGRTITGTPTVVTAETSYTYTATDEDGDTATVTFTITVVELILGGEGTGGGTEKDSEPVCQWDDRQSDLC